MQLARKPHVLIALLLSTALVVGACGGGDDEDAAATTTTAEVDGTTTSTTAAPGGEVAADIDETIWYGGFSVELGEVTAPAEGEAGTVEVAVAYENLAVDAATFDGTDLLLSSAGTDHSIDLLASEIPEVPGERAADGIWAFEVDDTFTIDDAVLTIGGADVNQAVVPLGDEGELVTLEPVELELTGQATADGLDAEVTGGEVRADIPDTHTQMDEGRLALHLTFDITFTASDPSYTGGYAFAGANLALVLPDGTTVTPLESPIELLDSGGTLRDQLVVFEIDNPPAGTYELVLIQNVGDPTQGTFAFELPDDIEIGTPAS